MKADKKYTVDFPTKTKLISKEEIQKVLNMPLCIDLVDKTYKAHGNNQVIMPPKITLDTGEFGDWPYYEGGYNAMPAYIGEEIDMSGMKWVWGFNDNYKRGLPLIGANILLNEAACGEPLAIMDGTYITAMRTAASSGVAAKYLARKDSSIIAIIGAGMQGRMNCRSVFSVFGNQIEEIRVQDLFTEVAEKCAEDMSRELGIKVKAAKTCEEACKDADIIITVTIADEPLVKKAWLKKGCTVLTLGSYQELEDSIVLECDKLVVDSWAQNTHRGEFVKLYEAGKVKEEDVHAEMPEIAVGRKPGRTNDDEMICASIIGIGSTDVYTAAYIYKEYFAARNDIPTFVFRQE